MSIVESKRRVAVGGGRDKTGRGLAWPSATDLGDVFRHGLPRRGLGALPDGTAVWRWRLRNLPNLWRGLRPLIWAKVHKIPTHYGALYLDLIKADGTRIPIGLASLRVVTSTGTAFIVDAFQNIVELENMKFHGFGTGGSAEATANTALTTELTTQYATDNTRPTGSQTENGANIYRSVATLDPDSDSAITEHGIFDQAAVGGGVMLDRTLFSVINVLAAGDTLQATYDFTVGAGG